MESSLLGFSGRFARIPEWVIRHRTGVLIPVIGFTLLMLWSAMSRTQLDMTIDSFIDQDDPAIHALNSFRSQFGSDDSVYLVYRADDGDVFSARSLHAAQTLTERLQNPHRLDPGQFPETVGGQPVDLDELSHIRRVESITTVRFQRGTEDTLLSERLVPADIPDDPARLAAIRDRALANDDHLLAFYSEDTRYAAIRIQTDFGAEPEDGYEPAINGQSISLDDSFSAPADPQGFALSFDEQATVQDIPFQTVDMADYSRFFTAVRAVYADQQEHLTFHPVGNPPLMDWVYRELQDMLWLAAIIILLFTTLLWSLFRSLSAVIWPMVIVSLSLLWAWGTISLVGMTLSTMITLTVMLVFTVGLADCIHVFSAYFSLRRDRKSHEQALAGAYDKTGLAILITTVTTMCGVLSLTWSDLVPIRVFGIMSAIGILAALVLTLTLLPILLDLWRPGAPSPGLRDRPPGSGRFHWLSPDRWLPRCPDLVRRGPGTVLILFGAALIASLYGASRLQVDSNVSELTTAGSEPREAYRVVDQHMAGAQSISIMIDTGEVDGLVEPRMLRAMEQFQQRVEQRYSDRVSRSHSLADVVKETHRVMRNDDPEYESIPDSATLVTQLLYLFNSANPEERRSLVSDDYSRSHITLNAYNAGSYQYQTFFRELSEDIGLVYDPLESEFPALQVNVTGSIPLMMRAMDEIARSQYRSFLLALLVISVIMIATLGSVQAGLIAMVPNLIPALSAFGLMGLLSIPLDTDTLLIAPVIIGIAVDDTVHFMTHYRVALLRTRDMEQALYSTVRVVGKAVLFTTLVLAAGFAILGFSDYLGIAKIGLFGSMAIIIALLCDLFLLPAMLMIFRPRFGIKALDSFRAKETPA
ncbi:MAG: efflux RND transporter permease subunit [Pseudomonadota bacterium]